MADGPFNITYPVFKTDLLNSVKLIKTHILLLSICKSKTFFIVIYRTVLKFIIT